MPESPEEGFADYAVTEEIETLAALMVAALESDEPLDQRQIDTLVGLSPESAPVDYHRQWLRPAENLPNWIFQT